MSETIYAAFADAAHAESAAGALLDHGVSAQNISLVLNEEAKKRVQGYEDAATIGSQPTLPSGPTGGMGTFDPLGNNLRGAVPPVPGGNLFPVGETAEVNHDLNPAQNDYPRTGSSSPTELSSRPPESKYDWNADLDKKSYNAHYSGSTSEAVDDEIRKEHERDRARVDPASNVIENDEGTTGRVASTAGHVADLQDVNDDAERAAKAGVTTTTIQDAAKGAAKGVGIGLGVGALAAVASIAIPGVGLVIGGGALAAAAAGLAATAGAGAVAGGIVGYLKDQGVPADHIPAYQHAYENGGAILTVTLDEAGVDRTKIEALLNKYGGSEVRNFGYVS